MQVVSRDIRRILTQRAQYFNIYLDDVSITNLTFSREYTGAVEAKQVAQQEAERARFIVRPTIACLLMSCNLVQFHWQGQVNRSLAAVLQKCRDSEGCSCLLFDVALAQSSQYVKSVCRSHSLLKEQDQNCSRGS